MKPQTPQNKTVVRSSKVSSKYVIKYWSKFPLFSVASDRFIICIKAINICTWHTEQYSHIIGIRHYVRLKKFFVFLSDIEENEKLETTSFSVFGEEKYIRELELIL